jgi:hypothetical protein
LSLSGCNTKIPLEECSAKLERGDNFKPRVISEDLNKNYRDNVVGIGIFATHKDVIPKGTPSRHLRIHLVLLRWKDSHSDRSHFERLEMAHA